LQTGVCNAVAETLLPRLIQLVGKTIESLQLHVWTTGAGEARELVTIPRQQMIEYLEPLEKLLQCRLLHTFSIRFLTRNQDEDEATLFPFVCLQRPASSLAWDATVQHFDRDSDDDAGRHHLAVLRLAGGRTVWNKWRFVQCPES